MPSTDRGRLTRGSHLPLAPSLPTSCCFRQPRCSRVVACHSGRYSVSLHRHLRHLLPLPLLFVAQGCSQHAEWSEGRYVPQGSWNVNHSFAAAAVFAPWAWTRPRPRFPRHVHACRGRHCSPPHHGRPLRRRPRELAQRCYARLGFAASA